MSTNVDLARQEAQSITDPATGELIDRADVEKVVDLYRRIKEVQAQWADALAWCARALIDAADERSVWVFSAAGANVKVDPPNTSTIRWNFDELHKLEALLPAERYAELVEQTVWEKAKTGKLQTLARQAGADSEIGRIINQAEVRIPATRSVKVTR